MVTSSGPGDRSLTDAAPLVRDVVDAVVDRASGGAAVPFAFAHCLSNRFHFLRGAAIPATVIMGYPSAFPPPSRPILQLDPFHS